MSTSSSDLDFDTRKKRVSKIASGRESLVDPIGVAHAKRLLDRAASLPAPSRGPLLARLDATIDALTARVEGRKDRATQRIDALSDAGIDVTELRTELARGATDVVEYRYRRRLRLGRDARRVAPSTEAKLASLARSMGISVDPERPLPLFELASQLYDRSAAEATAALLLYGLPSSTGDEGRYHTTSVVASVLRAMHDASPTYLRAMLGRFELAAGIARFLRSFEPIAPPPVEKPERARKPRGKKRG